MLVWDYLFWLAAAVGLGGAGLGLSRMLPLKLPRFMRTVHGMAALFLTGAVFIANLVHENATPTVAWWALAVFAAGLVGGLLFFRVLGRGRPPLWLILGHGSLGLSGVYLLYLASSLAA